MSSQPRSFAARALRRAVVLASLVGASALFAGTPLICHPYAIGDAKSLPSGPDWHGVSRSYDRKHLTRDTLALLQADTPIIVRMETLRRAAIYATAEMRDWDKGRYSAEDRGVAMDLFTQLQARSQHVSGPALGLALFDAGFFVETLRHARMDLGVDGYKLLARAAELRGPEPEVEFALALASSWPKRKEHDTHLTRARTGAKPSSLLATNLATHFQKS